MQKTNLLIEKANSFGAHNYHPLSVVLTRGQGSKVWDVEGKEYLDFLASYSALNFGHQHPQLVAAMTAQLGKLAVCSRAFHSEELSLFLEELSQFCGMDCALPMNTGTEAVETALKIARKWATTQKKIPSNESEIITFHHNFHGRTISIISFSTEENYKKDFGPFTPGFVSVPYRDIDAIEKVANAKTAAILIEPIQAEAGILVPPPGFLTLLYKFCQKNRILFIADEIQTGLGRTGKKFCVEHEGISPDILILGKSLGGGLLPLSAVVSKREVMDVLQPGQHGSTFGGNPLACAVGRKVLQIFTAENLAERAEEMGKKIRQKLGEREIPCIQEIRGKGALIGIEIKKEFGPARKYSEKLAQKGVLCKETHEKVLRLAPPLTISWNELMQGVDRICDVLRE